MYLAYQEPLFQISQLETLVCCSLISVLHSLVFRLASTRTFHVSFTCQSFGKINGITCVQLIGCTGNKMLHMHRFSSLFISILKENEIKEHSWVLSYCRSWSWSNRLGKEVDFLSRTIKVSCWTFPFPNWFSACGHVPLKFIRVSDFLCNMLILCFRYMMKYFISIYRNLQRIEDLKMVK